MASCAGVKPVMLRMALQMSFWLSGPTIAFAVKNGVPFSEIWVNVCQNTDWSDGGRVSETA